MMEIIYIGTKFVPVKIWEGTYLYGTNLCGLGQYSNSKVSLRTGVHCTERRTSTRTAVVSLVDTCTRQLSAGS